MTRKKRAKTNPYLSHEEDQAQQLRLATGQDPTPDQIAKLCEDIRKDWPECRYTPYRTNYSVPIIPTRGFIDT